jgi:hypothetical protein
VHKITA